MKAVNLVPKDYRRGRLSGRGGEVFSYAVIGGLVAVLLAVVAVVLTGNKVSDNKSEVAKLQQQLDDAQTEASALAPYSNFASLAQARIATVSSLAQSRFDWERVMRELSQVIPSDVWLTKLTGTVVHLGTGARDRRLRDGAGRRRQVRRRSREHRRRHSRRGPEFRQACWRNGGPERRHWRGDWRFRRGMLYQALDPHLPGHSRVRRGPRAGDGGRWNRDPCTVDSGADDADHADHARPERRPAATGRPAAVGAADQGQGSKGNPLHPGELTCARTRETS